MKYFLVFLRCFLTVIKILLRKLYFILLIFMLLCIACELHLKPNGNQKDDSNVEVLRYDKLESQYLTTGDFSALQQMNTGYPNETRTLIEDVLKLGEVNDPDINNKFLNYYQDTILQQLIIDTEEKYSNMDDINKQLNNAFKRLNKKLPKIKKPRIYAQIGALDQSIIINENSLGISLDKYLGEDYPLYKKYYSDDQIKMMTSSFIVPDCMGFYLLSIYPMPTKDSLTRSEKNLHMAKIQWVVDKAMKKNTFGNLREVKIVDAYMRKHPAVTTDQLLSNNDYQSIIEQSGI